MDAAGFNFETDFKDTKRLIKEMCAENNLNLKKIYSDKKALLGSREKTIIFCGFTDKDDDLSFIRTLKGQGRICLYIGYSENPTDAEAIIGAFAAARKRKSAALSASIRAAKRKNAELGRVPNAVFGYDKVSGELFRMSINTGEAETVKRIFSLYTKEKIGLGAIADILNSENIKTKRGCTWSQNAVSRILKNQIYIGKITSCKQRSDIESGRRIENDKSDFVTVLNEDMRIIDDDMFSSAQVLLKSKGYNFTKKGEEKLFAELIKCGECGSAFRRISRTYKNTYVSWICSGRNSKGIKFCGNSFAIAEEELANALRDYFKELIKNRNKAESFLEAEAKKINPDLSRGEFGQIIKNGFENMKRAADGENNFSEVISHMTAYKDGTVDIYLKMAVDMGVNKTIDL